MSSVENNFDSAHVTEGDSLAFVLMPFEQEFDRIYWDLIKPALEDEGFEVRRADSTFDQQNILRTIVHNIDTADLIVAELTTSNPNVFYELGIAHGLSKRVVLIAQELKDVPFDLRSYNIITYSTRFNEVHELQDRLKNVARGLRAGSINFGSPVDDFAPSAYKMSHHAAGEPVLTMPEDQPGEVEEVEGEDSGVLDFVAEVEDSMADIASIAVSFTGMIEQFGEKTEKLNAETEKLNKSESPGGAVRLRKVTGAFASEIKKLGDDIRTELPAFHNAWRRMVDGFSNLLSVSEVNSAGDREQAIVLLEQLEAFRGAIGPSFEGLQEARDAFAANIGLSRELNVAIRSTVKVMDDLQEELSTGESYLTRMINLLDQEISNIGISRPAEGDTVTDPVRIVGSGRTPEGGNISVRIKNNAGIVLAESIAASGRASEMEPFEVQLSFSNRPRGRKGTIEAYATSADGTEVDLVSVPVKFRAKKASEQ